MSAQQTNQPSTSQSASREDQQSQKAALARRGMFGLPSLWTGPAEVFNPFSLMRRMQEEMNRVFAQSGFTGTGVGEDLTSTPWTPALEINSKDNAVEISAELPGLKNDDIKVEIDDDVLVIRGERKVEHESTEGGVRRSERRYGQFYRAIPLPEGANTEGARAEFENGLLRITIPVSQAKSKARQIPIQSQGTAKGTVKSEKAA